MSQKRPPGCENCKKPCTIHLTQIVNGAIKKLDMCESCPNAIKLQDPVEMGLMEQLLGVAKQKGVSMPENLMGEKICQTCGFTETQFRKTGRLGCSDCYDVFVLPKADLLHKIQEAVLHKGKVPKHQDKRDLKLQIVSLNKELATCITQEDYEAAAKIRDKIKALKASCDIADDPSKK